MRNDKETSLIEHVRKTAKKEYEQYSPWEWKFHIIPVVKYARLLAKKLNADDEFAELGALLHDIGLTKSGKADHEKTGIPEAERILKSAGYSEKIIEEIKHCVESHRASKDVKPKTIIAKIVANADAMAHFDTIPGLMQIALKRENNDPDKAFWWLYDKIERDWEKKLTLPEAKEMMRVKYAAFKTLFDAMKDHVEKRL